MYKSEKFGQVEKISPEDRLCKDLISFIVENKFSSKDVETAYYAACDSEHVPLEDHLVTLYEKIQSMVNGGFPLNRFVGIIEHLYRYEHGKELYLDYISSLNISDQEKQVLVSLLVKRRPGELKLYYGEEEDPFVSVIIKKSDTVSDQVLGYFLLTELEKLMKQYGSREQIQISFEEE